MKKLLFFIILVLYSTISKAEYNGYHITFSITLTNGKILKGYAYVASAYLDTDSLNNTGYLKKALDRSDKDFDKRDTLSYYTSRIKYEYSNLWDSIGENKQTIYTLTNQAKISFNSIKKITIDQMIDQTYMIGIASELKLSDTLWMKKDPVKRIQFGGYLCSYTLYIHVNSKAATAIIKEAQKKQQEIDKRLKESESSNEEELDENFDAMDEEIYKIIEKLKGQKIVIIAECSC